MIKSCLILTLSCLSFNLHAQDTLYFDANRKQVKGGNHSFYKIINSDPENDEFTIEHLHEKEGMLLSSQVYENYDSKRRSVISYTRFYSNGQVHLQRNMKKGKRNGLLLSYWENDQLKRKDLYKNGRFISGQCWDASGGEVTHYPFEIDSEFPGGDQKLEEYLQENTDPKYASSTYRGQKVILKFAILKDGSISDIVVISGGHVNLKIEAVRLVENMPKWSPGYMDGEAIKITKILPILF